MPLTLQGPVSLPAFIATQRLKVIPGAKVCPCGKPSEVAAITRDGITNIRTLGVCKADLEQHRRDEAARASHERPTL
jgi:hypothetical protein